MHDRRGRSLILVKVFGSAAAFTFTVPHVHMENDGRTGRATDPRLD